MYQTLHNKLDTKKKKGNKIGSALIELFFWLADFHVFSELAALSYTSLKLNADALGPGICQ